jgi:hypothetical protein
MKSYYVPAFVNSAETGVPSLILRPEIAIFVGGPRGSGQYQALVDTGADNTILPKSVADEWGIELVRGAGPPLTAFGGQQLATYFGDAEFEMQDEQTSIRWKARVLFFDFPSADQESLVLGHTRFLDYFTATFDGEQATLTLTANDELPSVE